MANRWRVDSASPPKSSVVAKSAANAGAGSGAGPIAAVGGAKSAMLAILLIKKSAKHCIFDQVAICSLQRALDLCDFTLFYL
jgi:hypothetical protein